MRRKHTAIAVLLTLCLLLCMLAPVSACAEEKRETYRSGYYEYAILDDGSIEITHYSVFSGDSSELTIPDTINGKSVTGIGEKAFAHCDSLSSVTIPDSVTTIGNYAFDNCDTLTTITIPDSVTTIGDSAFALCDSLASITIPNSVTAIDDSVFAKCDSLTSIAIPDSVTSIGNGAFSWCYYLTSITIPDSVTTIGEGAFGYCSPDLCMTVGRDSYAKQYAIENGIQYTYPDSNDWLNG